MAILKAADLETVRRQQVKNILTKQAAGKTLSAREERTLAEAACDAPAGGENFVTTYPQLAQRLQISRRGLTKVCQRFPNDFPIPRADGRHDVTAWLQFFTAKNIKGAAEDIGGDNSPLTVTDWKARELELKCTKLEIENAKVAGELVDAAEVESGVAVLLGAFRQALNNLAPRLAGKIVGVKDYHEAEEICIEEINVVLRTLQRCDFLKLLESGAPQLVASTSPDHAQRIETRRPVESGEARHFSKSKVKEPKGLKRAKSPATASASISSTRPRGVEGKKSSAVKRKPGRKRKGS